MVTVIPQDTHKLLSIILSDSIIVKDIERTCAFDSTRLFLYLYQMLIEIPFFKKIDLFYLISAIVFMQSPIVAIQDAVFAV